MHPRSTARTSAFTAAAVSLLLLAASACTNPPPASAGLVKEKAPGGTGLNVYRQKDLAAAGRPHPVVVWVNGGCVTYDGPWDTILYGLAAAGYVVVSVSAPPGQISVSQAGIADQKRAIDWAASVNAGTGIYAGKLDMTRVIAAGNSCGGITSLGLAGQDDRVKAVFVLSGSSGFGEAQAQVNMPKVKVPVGYVSGGPTDLSRANIEADLTFLGAGIPGFWALRNEGDHVKVSTDIGVLEEATEIAVSWLNFAVYGDAAA